MPDMPTEINWPQAIRSLQQRLPAEAIEPSVLTQLRGAGCVLIACSGGADSVFLLCLLVARAEELGLQLKLAHYNHRWRGDASDADAAFVESLAAALDLPYYSAVRPVYEAAFTETTARALRLEFLRKIAKQQNCNYIVFGHQLDDILETQLQRIARGSASDGLSAPRPVAGFDRYPTHLRPLLGLRAGDIRMMLNASSIPWCEDSSNDDTNIARNALRQQVIPDLFEAIGRDPAVGAARSRRLLEEDAAALDLLARQFLPDAYAGAATLTRASLRAVPTALLRRALAEWLSGHELIGSVGAPAMDLLIEVLRSDRVQYRMSAGSHFILINANTLSWEHEDAVAQFQALQPATIEFGEPVFLSTGALFTAEVVELDLALRQQIQSGGIDPQTEAIISYEGATSLEIRAWQPGDRFQPLGAPGRKKLKDWFIDRRIPQTERKTLPLVLNASQEVIWVPGFAPAESCKIHPATKEALRLTYETRKPL